MTALRRIGTHAARFVVKVWMGIGIALLLLACAEGVFRVGESAIGLLDRRPQGSPSEADIVYEPHVISEVLREQGRALARQTWRPFVYHRQQPFAGRYVTVDSAGLRRTINGIGASRQILLFGGSAMWGVGLRDSATVPSQLVTALAQAGIVDARVTNLGQPGYVFTQEAIELALHLRDGARPVAVVFYDGVDDVSAAVHTGVSGVPADEVDRYRDYHVGKRIFNWHNDVGADWSALRQLPAVLARRSHLLARLRAHSRHCAPPSESFLVREVARMHASTRSIVDALAQEYHFTPLYVWQPSLYTTRKRLTSFERRAASSDSDDCSRTVSRVSQLLGAKLAESRDSAGGRFLDLSALFDAETATVFVDRASNTTEAASGTVARALAARLVPTLARTRNEHAVGRGGAPMHAVSETRSSRG